MRALLQRVSSASVTVDTRTHGAIANGLVAFVGVTHTDAPGDADWLARKIAQLRVFPDAAGQMNRDVRESEGAVLVVPQFTLYGDARHGRRPDFVAAARPEQAEPLIERLCVALAGEGARVERGVFRAHMHVSLVNDGPVTLALESPRPEMRAGVDR